MHLPGAAREREDYHAARRENETTVWNPPCSGDALVISGNDSSVRDYVPARVASELLCEMSLKIVSERDGSRIVRDLYLRHDLFEPQVPTP